MRRIVARQKPHPFVKPFPAEVELKLRSTVGKMYSRKGDQAVYRWMEKMEPVDHRRTGFFFTALNILDGKDIRELKNGFKAFFTKSGQIKTKHTGGRIRRIVVSVRGKKTEVILKRTQRSGAFRTVSTIGRKVQSYNERPAKKRSSEVVMPAVYILAKNLIAMQRIPGLRKGALTRVLNANNIPRRKYYWELLKTSKLLRIDPDQIECVGVNPQTRKLVFMPLLDLI